MIDIHCHILPGLDDGAQSMVDALGMAAAAEHEGIRKIIATPHLFRDNYDHDDLSIMERKLQELEKNIARNNIKVEIFPGAEVHVSHNLIEQIKTNKPYLMLNGSSYLLVEFPSDHIFSGVGELFFDLMSEDITPIIAHPERNSVLARHPEMLYELVQRGCLAQANSGSLMDLYGESVKETVMKLLEWRLIHFIGSDGHSVKAISPGFSEAFALVREHFGERTAQALMFLNPHAVLEDRAVPYQPDPVNPLKKRKSLRIRIPQIFRRGK
jgi:protein-tyrosine phosphatase